MMTWQRTRTTALFAIAFANVVCFISKHHIGEYIADGPEVRFSVGAAVPAGYRSDGSFDDPKRLGAPCYVVRYVKKDCRFCWRDKAQWNQLATLSRSAGCGIVGVVPEETAVMPDDAYGQAANQQLILTRMDWIKDTPPSRTPTTLLAGRSGVVIWKHVGLIDDSDVREASIALKTTWR